MKFFKYFTLLFLFFTYSFGGFLIGKPEQGGVSSSGSANNFNNLKTVNKVAFYKKRKSRKVASKNKRSKRLIDFSFNNATLREMVNYFASKKKINVTFLPPSNQQQPELDRINTRVTFKPSRKLTLDEAEKYLQLFLNSADYALTSRGDFVSIVDMSSGVSLGRDFPGIPFFLFGDGIDLKASDLPDSDALVRVMYRFSNLQVKPKGANQAASGDVIGIILNNALDKGRLEDLIQDQPANTVTFVERSKVARSVVGLLQEFEGIASRFVIKNLRLSNSSAKDVAELVKNIQSGGGRGSAFDRFRFVSNFIASDIRVFADDDLNSLMVMGKSESVERLTRFIRENIDVPIGTGKSIFHVYDVKYLESEDLARVLNEVILTKTEASQATKTKTKKRFDGVVVRAEKLEKKSGDKDSKDLQTWRGGNRLIIAAMPSDWEQIKKLLEELDVPRRQVIVEFLLVDYERNPKKFLKTQFRNPTNFDFKEGFDVQSAQMNSNIIPSEDKVTVDGKSYYPEKTNIAGDLMRTAKGLGVALQVDGNAPPGAGVFTFKDPCGTGIYGIISLLNEISNSKVISSPYLTICSGEKAEIISTELQRAPDMNATPSSGGSLKAEIGDIKAVNKVIVTPLISSKEKLILDLEVQIEIFTDEVFSRSNRYLKTQVTMRSSDQVFVLGGLTRDVKESEVKRKPLLSRIPILGNLFKGSSKEKQDTELAIFVRATIVEPRVRDSMDKFTRKKIDKVDKKGEFGGASLFDGSKDPFDQLFFDTAGKEMSNKEAIKRYIEETGDDKLYAKEG